MNWDRTDKAGMMLNSPRLAGVQGLEPQLTDPELVCRRGLGRTLRLASMTIRLSGRSIASPPIVAPIPAFVTLQKKRMTTPNATTPCRHGPASLDSDPETGDVWCFACKPPRNLSAELRRECDNHASGKPAQEA